MQTCGAGIMSADDLYSTSGSLWLLRKRRQIQNRKQSG